MNDGLTFSRLPGLARISIALLATSAVFTAGCANMATTATGVSSMDSGAIISGKLHGGNQPVGNAVVNLWYVGEGSTPPSIVATTKTANNGTGSFSFVEGGTGTNHFTCPSSTDPLVYVVATGGNTLNTGDTSVNNTASVFIAPFGLCSLIAVNHPFVDMTEVTTVATMVALQQYFNPAGVSTGGSVAESFSTDGTGLAKTAMTNAMATVSNLVNLATGTAYTSLNPLTIPAGAFTAGVGYSGTSVTAVPEGRKINVLANILASCINNADATAANCGTLFTTVGQALPDPLTTSKPSATFSTPTDVLQALYYMLTNPTNGGNLSTLYNLSSAAGAPFQPVLSSAPSDWTVAISYSSASTCGTGAGHLINSAQDLAVDTYGAIWLANNETTVGNLTQLSATGIPITCIQVGSGANTGVAIDSLGNTGSNSNIWLADNGSSNVYRYYPGTSSATPFPTAKNPLAIAADGTGGVYFTSPADTSLYEIPGAATAPSAVTPVAILTSTGPLPSHVMVDSTSSHAVWTTSGAAYVTRTAVTKLSPLTTSSIQVVAGSPTYGLSITAIPTTGTKDFVYVGSAGASNSLAQFQGIGASYAAGPFWSVPVTGLSTPAAVASDGAMNVWTIDNASSAVVEVGANFQALSPTSGFQKSSTYLGAGRSMVIDQAGNVWIGQDGTNSITEIVGAAVPVYQPYATGLKGGLFQTIP